MIYTDSIFTTVLMQYCILMAYVTHQTKNYCKYSFMATKSYLFTQIQTFLRQHQNIFRPQNGSNKLVIILCKPLSCKPISFEQNCFFFMIRVVSPIKPGRQLGRLAKIYFLKISFLFVRYLLRFFSKLFDTMGTMGYTALITFVAKYLVEIYVNFCLLC